MSHVRRLPRLSRLLGGVILVALASVGMTTLSDAASCGDGTFCVGAASVDMTWHTGSGQGQYGSEGNGATSGKFDPFHHQTKMVPSDGMQSRTYSKAIVVQGKDGTKVAYAKTELYLQQDLLTRRVGDLVSGRDQVVRDYVVPGLAATNVMLGGTHNHSAPYYASTAWGVWVFTDAFDFRMFEATARKIARSIKDANDTLEPARVGGSVRRFGDVQQNILGPTTADDGTPAGFPYSHFDDQLSVIRFEALDNGAPIAAWVNLGMHPESLSTMDLISSDFVGVVERVVERRLGRAPGAPLGPVVAWSQGSVGDVEPDRDGRAHPTSEKRQYWHNDTAQMERMATVVSDAVLGTWGDVATPSAAVPLSSDQPVKMVDHRFAGPVTHPLPTVSGCRTEEAGVALIGGPPDCERAFGEPPEQFGTTLDTLSDAGIPVPENYGPPSHTGVQESTTIHLQAIRIGEILIASCPCEPISDMVLNFKSRANNKPGDIYDGFDWTCREAAGGGHECDFRRAAHQPADWRRVDEAAYVRMKAQIHNNASGWEDDVTSLQTETEPDDPAAIFGNFTKRELGGGYKMPFMVGQANDYVGYVVTYREYQRGDHYRKALTAFGPHTADYINTRLVDMAAFLKDEGPAVADAMTTAPTSPLDDLIQQAKTLALGGGGSAGLAGYELAIPDDGGAGGRILSQPAKSMQRFDAASLTWQGGSNWTDNPVVKVQRRNADGGWTTVATQEGGEIVLTLRYEEPGPEAALAWLSGGKTYEWTATWEVFDETSPGTYRFFADGHHRTGHAPIQYTVESEAFDVRPWEGVAVNDLTVDSASRTARFKVDGVEATTQTAHLETDDDGVIGPNEIHYPETYESALPYISHAYSTVGSHRYCLRCTFRPWANTGEIAATRIAVKSVDGSIRRYDAQLVGDTWVASGLDLAKGDVVLVERGGVRDAFGNINGASTSLAPLTDLAARTALTYTGARSGKIGKKVRVTAVLRTGGGEPVAGQMISFTRGAKTVRARTDSNGHATTLLPVTAPAGSSRPIAVRFAGTDAYLSSSLTVGFTATR